MRDLIACNTAYEFSTTRLQVNQLNLLALLCKRTRFRNSS